MAEPSNYAPSHFRTLALSHPRTVARTLAPSHPRTVARGLPATGRGVRQFV